MLFGGGGGAVWLWGVWAALGAVVVLPVLPSMSFLPLEHPRAGSPSIRKQNFPGKWSGGWDHAGRSCWSIRSGKPCLSCHRSGEALHGARGWQIPVFLLAAGQCVLLGKNPKVLRGFSPPPPPHQTNLHAEGKAQSDFNSFGCHLTEWQTHLVVSTD